MEAKKQKTGEAQGSRLSQWLNYLLSNQRLGEPIRRTTRTDIDIG